MTFHSGRAKKNTTRNYLIAFFLFIAVVFFWLSLRSFLHPIIEPLMFTYGDIKTSIGKVSSQLHVYVESKQNVIEKNKLLQQQVEQLENTLAEKEANLRETTLIESEKSLAPTSGILIMYPIMIDTTRIYGTIVLTKGYKDGVEKDSFVYIRGLQPVCKIEEVYTSTSLCKLISADGVSTDAVILTSSTTLNVQLIGRGGGTFLAEVPRDTTVEIGNKVLLRSDQSMNLGTVVDVLKSEQDTSWHVIINGTYNPVTSSVFYIRKK